MENQYITFLHSGDMGDIVAGLPAIKEICQSQNKKAILFLDTTGGYSCNDDKLNDLIKAQTHGIGLKFNDKAFEFLKPLLEYQPYISKVEKWFPALMCKIDYNLNNFRVAFSDGTIASKTNQNLMYVQQVACGLTFGWKGSWLTCEKRTYPKKLVIARSCRCQSASAFFTIHEESIGKLGYFIGTDVEYAAFKESVRFPPERFNIDNALDAAMLMNAADMVIANSSLFFWIAVGLGKGVLHELPVDIPTTYFPSVEQIKYIQGMKMVK